MPENSYFPRAHAVAYVMMAFASPGSRCMNLLLTMRLSFTIRAEGAFKCGGYFKRTGVPVGGAGAD